MDRNEVFISYAHEDYSWLKDIQTHLEPLKLYYNYNIWDDKQIVTGDDWHEKIQASLRRCKVAICLFSPHFLASSYVKDHELLKILANATSEGLKIFSVHLKPCLHEAAKLDKFLALNDPEQPLSELQETECQRLFVKLARDVKKTLDSSIEVKVERDGKIDFLQLTLLLATLIRQGNGDITELQKRTGFKRKWIVTALPRLEETGLVERLKEVKMKKPSTKWKASDKGTHFYQEFEINLNSIN